MKELNIENKQEIYEYLLTIACPDTLAALIAERSEETLAWHESLHDSEYPLTLSSLISGAFLWDETPEGVEFWWEITQEIGDIEKGKPTAQVTSNVEWVPTTILSEVTEELVDCNQEHSKPTTANKINLKIAGTIALAGLFFYSVFKYTGVI